MCSTLFFQLYYHQHNLWFIELGVIKHDVGTLGIVTVRSTWRVNSVSSMNHCFVICAYDFAFLVKDVKENVPQTSLPSCHLAPF